jgi:hypothetical protein
MTQPEVIPTTGDPMMNALEAARYLGLVGTVKYPQQATRALARRRRVRSTKVCGKVMFRRSWLDAYIEGNVREPVGMGTGDKVR